MSVSHKARQHPRTTRTRRAHPAAATNAATGTADPADAAKVCTEPDTRAQPSTRPQPGNAADNAPAAPLGNTPVTTLGQLDNRSSATRIYRAQTALWAHALAKVLRECHRVARPGTAEVGVVSDGGTAGLCNSRSRLSPLAARHLYREESLDMQAHAAAWTRKVPGRVRHALDMATFTIPHGPQHRLADLLAVVQSAWQYVNSSDAWKRLKEQYGIAGWDWTLEVTLGGNGWHPHRHMLIFFEKRLTRRQHAELVAALFDLWCEGVVRQGHPAPTRERGVHMTHAAGGDAADLAGYLAKGMALEVTGALNKQGRNGGRTLHELLLDIADHGNPGDIALFREAEQALRGIRWRGASRGLKQMMRQLGATAERAKLVAEWEKQQVEAGKKPVPRTVLVAISPADWKKISKDARARAALDRAARTGDTAEARLASVSCFLDGLGIEYRPVMQSVEAYEPPPRSVVHSMQMRDDARMVAELMRARTDALRRRAAVFA